METRRNFKESREKVQILLVEDDPNDAELSMMALKDARLNIEVTHLENGAEALDYLFGTGLYADRKDRSLPQLILMDLHMPKVDGTEVLRQIKSDPRTSAIPVVIMTSSQEESDIIETYKLGVNSYIVKPVGFEKFIEAVKEIGVYWTLLNHPPM